ncbi:MAG: PQQ-binding-like beta-propeller repeat protein [Phycisphaerae bacterium]|nr:PQQ-binding-like beta-propeller repeat protein [Phycisphaerae bacterium]
MRREKEEVSVLCALLLGTSVWAACPLPVTAADWPTYRHDGARSGVTAEGPVLPLHEQWRHEPAHPPAPAWPKPAGADLWHDAAKLDPAVTYDRAFHVAVVGDSVFFGSSSEDTVTCLDATTGKARWTFTADGPVRLAPCIAGGKAYFGSDDGWVYCLRAGDGSLVWRYRAAEEDRRIPGNGRMISSCPVRTGVVVRGAVAYVCSGLFPNEGVFVSALDAESGRAIWRVREARVSPQGYLIASATRLYVPTGRTTPAVFDLESGKYLGSIKGDRAEGGTFALLADDGLIYGPGEFGRMAVAETDRPDRIASFAGLRLIARAKVSYLQTKTELIAFDRAAYVEERRQVEELVQKRNEVVRKLKKLGVRIGGKEGKALREELAAIGADIDRLGQRKGTEPVWRRASGLCHSLILAGDVLIAGGENEVAAFRGSDGEPLWRGKVSGRACGLAAAGGRLFVSTDSGTIHCFGSPAREAPSIVRAAASQPQQSATGESAGGVVKTVEQIVAKTGITKGFCLVLGCGGGQLAAELAQRTELQIVGVDTDEGRVRSARALLQRAGLYGRRVSVHHVASPVLPFSDCTMSLVVCGGSGGANGSMGSPDEVYRLLRPGGGVAYLGSADGEGIAKLRQWCGQATAGKWEASEEGGGWVVCRRQRLPGGRDWTHMYADAANTACSGDAVSSDSMRLQWFGQPGPREIVDRHHRNVPPLVRDGRVFIPGHDRIIAADAYNGVELWRLDVPKSLRLGAPFDSGNMVVGADRLYLAVLGRCLVLAAATGRQVSAFDVPRVVEGERHWGYVGLVGDSLFGSACRPGATYTEISRDADAYQWGDYKRMVTSDALFCMDAGTGEVRWTYAGGVIVNPSIAIGGGRVYFVESHAPEAVKDEDGQMRLDILTRGRTDLVALDAKTGKGVWRQAVDLKAFKHILYLIYADEVLLAFGTRNHAKNLWHDVAAFEARTGAARWQRSNDTGWERGGTHGEQERHPVVVGKTIYIEAHAYDLHTGESVSNWKFDFDRRGCGTVTGSARGLFFRDRYPMAMDLTDRRATALSRVSRPGCWVNIIPACGLVVVPEGSSGCTCGYPIQTSMGFAPVAKRVSVSGE